MFILKLLALSSLGLAFFLGGITSFVVREVFNLWFVSGNRFSKKAQLAAIAVLLVPFALISLGVITVAAGDAICVFILGMIATVAYTVVFKS